MRFVVNPVGQRLFHGDLLVPKTDVAGHVDHHALRPDFETRRENRFRLLHPVEQRILLPLRQLHLRRDLRADQALHLLVVRRKHTKSRTYAIKNKSEKDKAILVEQAITRGWKLVEPAKPTEKTLTLYRFGVKVPASKTGELVVKEERTDAEYVSIRDAASARLVYWVKSGKVDPATKAILQRAIELKTKVAELQRKINELTAERRGIADGQTRITRNMKAVSSDSQYYKRLLTKLNDQETQIEKLDKEIKALKTKLEAAQKALDSFLADLMKKQ